MKLRKPNSPEPVKIKKKNAAEKLLEKVMSSRAQQPELSSSPIFDRNYSEKKGSQSDLMEIP